MNINLIAGVIWIVIVITRFLEEGLNLNTFLLTLATLCIWMYILAIEKLKEV